MIEFLCKMKFIKMVEEAGSSFEETDGLEKPSGADVQGSSILVLQVSKM